MTTMTGAGWLDMAMQLTKRFEGCRLTAYPDPASGADPWTIGYGATGYGICRDTTWTQEQADADLCNRLKTIGMRLEELVKVPVTDEQKAALCDFAYNLGLGALGGSTLMRLLNEGDALGAADEFGKWDKAAGQVMPGLVKRRDAERALFILGAS